MLTEEIFLNILGRKCNIKFQCFPRKVKSEKYYNVNSENLRKNFFDKLINNKSGESFHKNYPNRKNYDATDSEKIVDSDCE